jgi:hypothetical protein
MINAVLSFHLPTGPEDCDMFPQNAKYLSLEYPALFSRKQNSVLKILALSESL